MEVGRFFVGVKSIIKKSTYHKGMVDCVGWPVSLPYMYIQKSHVSVAIGTQSGIPLHERIPTYIKSDNGKVAISIKVHFHNFSSSCCRCCCCSVSVSTHVSQKLD